MQKYAFKTRLTTAPLDNYNNLGFRGLSPVQIGNSLSTNMDFLHAAGFLMANFAVETR